MQNAAVCDDIEAIIVKRERARIADFPEVRWKLRSRAADRFVRQVDPGVGFG
jgi:hypothetical protein